MEPHKSQKDVDVLKISSNRRSLHMSQVTKSVNTEEAYVEPHVIVCENGEKNAHVNRRSFNMLEVNLISIYFYLVTNLSIYFIFNLKVYIYLTGMYIYIYIHTHIYNTLVVYLSLFSQ